MDAPDYTEPEQYHVSTSKTPDGKPQVSVLPRTDRGQSLDKWRFVSRPDDRLVLVKRITGEKYRADHTVPSSLPHVINQVLRREGYEVAYPRAVTVYLPRGKGSPKHGTRVPITDDVADLSETPESKRAWAAEQLDAREIQHVGYDPADDDADADEASA